MSFKANKKPRIVRFVNEKRAEVFSTKVHKPVIPIEHHLFKYQVSVDRRQLSYE